jgi:acyl-CoA thioester hydrolase
MSGRPSPGRPTGPAGAFEHPIRVAPADLDVVGHVNNVVYLRYAQEAAIAHWSAAAPADRRAGEIWVARRHEIDYFRPALADDDLVARTWIDGATGATMDRVVEILRAATGELLARSRTVWVAIDGVTGRPKRLPAWVAEVLLHPA